MNSNLLEEEEEEIASLSLSLYRSHCSAGLHVMYAHPQSCSETKGQRNRQGKRQMEREKTEGVREKGRQETYKSGFSSLI